MLFMIDLRPGYLLLNEPLHINYIKADNLARGKKNRPGKFRAVYSMNYQH